MKKICFKKTSNLPIQNFKHPIHFKQSNSFYFWLLEYLNLCIQWILFTLSITRSGTFQHLMFLTYSECGLKRTFEWSFTNHQYDAKQIIFRLCRDSNEVHKFIYNFTFNKCELTVMLLFIRNWFVCLYAVYSSQRGKGYFFENIYIKINLSR